MKSHYQLSPHLTSFIVWTIKHKNTETFFKPYWSFGDSDLLTRLFSVGHYRSRSWYAWPYCVGDNLIGHYHSVNLYQVNHFTVFFDTHNGVSVIFTSFILIQWWYYMYIPTQINHYMPGPFLAMWSACVKSRGGGCSI